MSPVKGIASILRLFLSRRRGPQKRQYFATEQHRKAKRAQQPSKSAARLNQASGQTENQGGSGQGALLLRQVPEPRNDLKNATAYPPKADFHHR